MRRRNRPSFGRSIRSIGTGRFVSQRRRRAAKRSARRRRADRPTESGEATDEDGPPLQVVVPLSLLLLGTVGGLVFQAMRRTLDRLDRSAVSREGTAPPRVDLGRRHGQTRRSLRETDETDEGAYAGRATRRTQEDVEAEAAGVQAATDRPSRARSSPREPSRPRGCQSRRDTPSRLARPPGRSSPRSGRGRRGSLRRHARRGSHGRNGTCARSNRPRAPRRPCAGWTSPQAHAQPGQLKGHSRAPSSAGATGKSPTSTRSPAGCRAATGSSSAHLDSRGRPATLQPRRTRHTHPRECPPPRRLASGWAPRRVVPRTLRTPGRSNPLDRLEHDGFDERLPRRAGARQAGPRGACRRREPAAARRGRGAQPRRSTEPVARRPTIPSRASRPSGPPS